MIPDQEVAAIKEAMEKAKKDPAGLDLPVFHPDKKFPINLYCNDDLMPSEGTEGLSVFYEYDSNDDIIPRT